MRVSDIGEFPLIDRLQNIIATERPDVVVGIGDDVAVLAPDEGDSLLLATIDAQVEGIHFLRQLITPHQLGRRALAINLSDIAAMGGAPQFALVSLALPNDTAVYWIEAVYQGLRAEADRHGVAVVGGNMARTQANAVIDVCVLGRVRRHHLLLRSGAQPGDQVLVTGQLGDSAAGLRAVQNPEVTLAAAERDALLARYLTPTPRLPESAVIAGSRRATAMIDLSDGLSSDVGHICERSDVGVRIWAERLPISAAVRHVAEQTKTPAWELALAGGEDFELCFTAPETAVAELAALVEQETGTRVTVVGEILPPQEGRRLVLPEDQEIGLDATGWQHFREDDTS